MNKLPFQIGHVGTPPLKCQGIKTKLVPFIFSNLKWTAAKDACWIEPFLGSGVVAFNLAPERALLSDTNPHIIRFYRAIQSGELSKGAVQEFLGREGKKLAANGADYYYEVRNRFNKVGSSLDFLFLNRACFNGLIRFNGQGKFNVPFGHKPERFSQAYITKIANQVNWAAKQMQGKDWEFKIADWQETLKAATREDFVYLDPPYTGRHTDYYNSWGEDEAIRLAEPTRNLPCGFALSMWLENRYRKNNHVDEYWFGLEKRVFNHFYYIGASEDLRNEMNEALLIKADFAAIEIEKYSTKEQEEPVVQLAFALEN